MLDRLRSCPPAGLTRRNHPPSGGKADGPDEVEGSQGQRGALGVAADRGWGSRGDLEGSRSSVEETRRSRGCGADSNYVLSCHVK